MKMIVKFFKDESNRTCRWTARPSKGREFEGTTMAAGADIPHDLAQFVVESRLRIAAGFWGLVAHGAYFKTIRGRKPTAPGRALANEYRNELNEAESCANQHIFAWKKGEPTPLKSALDEMLVCWKSLGPGEPLELEWTSDRLERRQEADASSDGKVRGRRGRR